VPVTEERKLVTVLFADLVGSTARAGAEDPERVRVRLERFYETMSEEIERTGGAIEKFAGDAVMAVFGAPAAFEDHAERALHAALAMQHRLDELFGGELSMRVGVNTGEVVVGDPRVGSSFVAGDAVNVCDRLQKAAEPGEVLAGERTVAAASGAFEFGPLRVTDAKGKPEGVEGRPVLRSLTLMRPRGVPGFARVFVGRESELELLRASYRRAAVHAEPHLVTIVGEPGVGKTRLVRELWDLLTHEDPVPIRRTGRCLPYGDGITYWPLGEMLAEHLDLRESDGHELILERLEGREILGLALGLDVAPELHPLDARERLHGATVAFVEDLASGCPAVVLVEDIHWAEDDLLDLLERILADARAPVLLVSTARPELQARRPSWGIGGRNATVMWLDRLTPGEATRMLDEMLPTVLPDEMRSLVIERSEGNPFFLEELVGELVDGGVLVRVDGRWAMGETETGFTMPDTVYAVLAARIDRLPALEKAALQAGAVMGRAFWATPVVHLLDGEEPDFDLLEERDLIRSSRTSAIPGTREYAIKHALTREVAYDSISKARRGRLHAALADWLEQGELARDERAALLAYHYSQAVKPEDVDLVWADEAEQLARMRGRAVHWLRRAGELARGRYELDEAVELYARAVPLCDDEHECALVWRDLGKTHALRYDGEGMRTAMLAALEGPLDDAERADTLAMLAFQASVRSAMWSIRLNRRFIEDWADAASGLAEANTEARARAILARSNIEPLETTSDELDEAAAVAEALDSRELRSFTLGARAAAAFERRRFAEAATWSQERLGLLEEIDDPDHLCEAYEHSSPIAAAIGRFDDAKRLADLHWDLARRLSAHHRVHSVSLELELADILGDWDQAASRTDHVWDLVAANLKTPCVRNPRDLLLCALAHLCLGNESRAVELERDAARVGGSGYDSYLSGPRLRIAAQRGDRTAAEPLMELPLERGFVWGSGAMASRLDAFVTFGRRDFIEREAPVLVQPGAALEPFALRALGIARNDDELLIRADERFRALGLEWHRSQTERLLAGL
jgi:class 3 adenylate cyclase